MNMTQIHEKKIVLIGRVTSAGYKTTERDVAEAQELVNQYIDELEHLEGTAKPVDEIVIAVDGKTMRFANQDDFADWLAGAL